MHLGGVHRSLNRRTVADYEDRDQARPSDGMGIYSQMKTTTAAEPISGNKSNSSRSQIICRGKDVIVDQHIWFPMLKIGGCWNILRRLVLVASRLNSCSSMLA